MLKVIDVNPVMYLLILSLCEAESMHAFSSTVGGGSKSRDLFGDVIISFLTSSTVAGSNNIRRKFTCGESTLRVLEV